MPELAEVEASRHSLLNACRNLVIQSVVLKEQGEGPRHGLFDDLVFESSPNSADGSIEQNLSEYERSFCGRRLVDVKRKGKYLWLILERRSPKSKYFDGKKHSGSNAVDAEPMMIAVLFHFAMTGSFVIRGKSVASYKSFKVDTENWPPKFTKLEIIFENGIQVAFTDPRRLARIKLRPYPGIEALPPVSLLAIDPLIDKLPSADCLHAVLAKYRVSIKSLLLDQEKVFCGIGNYLADEILYQSAIHPETCACALSVGDVGQLLDRLAKIITTAVHHNTNHTDFPSDWLFHYRWSKRSTTNTNKMPNGNAIKFLTVGGRTSAIVEAVQGRPKTMQMGKSTNASQQTNLVTQLTVGVLSRPSKGRKSSSDLPSPGLPSTAAALASSVHKPEASLSKALKLTSSRKRTQLTSEDRSNMVGKTNKQSVGVRKKSLDEIMSSASTEHISGQRLVKEAIAESETGASSGRSLRSAKRVRVI